MLQGIRDRSTGWISKAIVGLIVVLLSFTGFEAIVRSTSNANNAAKVNGKEITKNELAQAASIQGRRLAQQFGQGFDLSQLDEKLLNRLALDSLISRELLLQAARTAGFSPSIQAIDNFIINSPDFQVNGVFNRDRFDQTIRAMGYGRAQFRQLLEQEMLLEQLQVGITGTAFVSEQDARALATLELQTRDFAALELSPNMEDVSIEVGAVQEFYELNKAQFMTKEQVTIEYLELNKQNLAEAVDVEEDELKQRYQDAIANLSEQRRVAHILFEINDEQNADQAFAKAKQAAERIAGGEAFAKLAKEMSEDLGSSEQGGDLGFAGKDVYEPAFEDAVYALKRNQVSEPIMTEYGWHLIKLLDVREADVISYEDMKPSLLRELREEKVEQEFVELAQELANLAYEASDLSQPAHQLGLETQVSAAFGREGGDGILANPQVLEAAFSQLVLEDGNNSDLLELDADTALVLRVKQHERSEQIELEQVADEIENILLAQEARLLNKNKGDALLQQLQSGELEPKQMESANWRSFEAAERNLDALDEAVIAELFRMPKPEPEANSFTGISLPDGRYFLLQLKGVSLPLDALSDEDISIYRNALSKRQGGEDFAAFMQHLEQTAKIERFIE